MSSPDINIWIVAMLNLTSLHQADPDITHPLSRRTATCGHFSFTLAIDGVSDLIHIAMFSTTDNHLNLDPGSRPAPSPASQPSCYHAFFATLPPSSMIERGVFHRHRGRDGLRSIGLLLMRFTSEIETEMTS